MSGPLADAVFALLVLACAVSHVFILRSTVRGMRSAAPRKHVAWEWTWAVLPAISLVVLFVWTWHTMHPDTLRFLIPADRVPVLRT